MKNLNEFVKRMESDLGIDKAFVRGQEIPVKNCWHFMTDGKAVDAMFFDEVDFVDGINRIFIVLKGYDVVILAFVLMDTHVHFVLYGTFEECNRFVHEYVRRTSMAITFRHGTMKSMSGVEVNYQLVDDQNYLKTVICYVLKNPVNAGLDYNYFDYPWSSGALYFRHHGIWTSPFWMLEGFPEDGLASRTMRCKKNLLKTNCHEIGDAPFDGEMVFPGVFVDYHLVESLFKTPKSMIYFLGKTKDEDVEFRDSCVSNLSIHMQELRQRKTELCQELFGERTIRKLTVQQRVLLARKLGLRENLCPLGLWEKADYPARGPRVGPSEIFLFLLNLPETLGAGFPYITSPTLFGKAFLPHAIIQKSLKDLKPSIV